MAVSYTQLYSDTFQRPDEDPLNSNGWESSGSPDPITNIPIGVQIINNLCVTGSTDIENITTESHYDGITPSNVSFLNVNDQYAEITIHDFDITDNNQKIAVGVRHQDTFTLGYITALFVNGNGGATPVTVAIVVDFGVGGSSTGVEIAAPVRGDILRLEVLGSTITSKYNGSVLETFTNTVYTSGSPAITMVAIADPTKMAVSSFRAGAINNQEVRGNVTNKYLGFQVPHVGGID